MDAALPAPPRDLARALSRWFLDVARDLPWRHDRTPYRVWLSEVMLQQTQVSVVEDYYRRFLARFPDVKSLADADLDDVLALWSGLGYYSRGRNLHKAARVVAHELGGVFPDSVEGLRALPGVGPYTAGAIASLSYDAAVHLVDGNVARVLSRLCDDETAIDSGPGRRALETRAKALVEVADSPRVLNEGLMELGALCCTPKSPACEACPWGGVCQARAAGTVHLRPQKLPKRARTALTVACALLYDDDAVYLERREEAGLFAGLFAPPSRPLEGRNKAPATVRALLVERGLKAPRRLQPAVRVDRTLTHKDLGFEVIAVEVDRDDLAADAAGRFLNVSELEGVGLSSAVRALLRAAWPHPDAKRIPSRK